MKVSISGIRGIFGDDLSLQEVSRFSRLFSSYIHNNFEQLSCVIARDSRHSGKIISDIVVGSLLEQGINVYDLDVIPTPVLFRESRKYSGAIMITASHNPMEWNGLKLLVNGRGLFEEELNIMLNNTIHVYTSTGEYNKIQSTYLKDLINYISISNDIKPDFKVGLDFGGGAACNYVNRLFQIYKIKYLSINDRYGFSSRGPDPTSDHLDELCELVKLNKLNFGLAFDMDGDRLVIVSHKGDTLSPDLTLLLCVAGAIHNKIKKFVISLDSSICIEKYIKEYGGEIFYSKVGESNVIKKITEVNGEAGGEGSSGGFIMPNFTSCRDGLLAGIILCSLDQKIVDECLHLASNFIQIRTKLPIKPEIKLNDMLEKISKVLTPYSNQVIDEDGFKFIFDDNSWVLVRPSNTEHVLRISLESEKDRSNSLYKLIYSKIYEIYEKI
ncbi:MAG: phosphomannomutase [Thermoproteota archaeon]|nr:phosphomannomutase [Thermoproteota archaeon]